MNWYSRQIIAQINPQMVQKIITEYRDGKLSGQIAAELGYSKWVILDVLKKHNVELRTRGGIGKEISQYQKEQIINLYQQNTPLRTISTRLGLPDPAIKRILQENNIPLRNDRGRPSQWSPEVEQEIIQKYRSGISMFQLGKDYSTTGSNIRQILVRNNIPIIQKDRSDYNRKPTWTHIGDEKKQQIISLYNQGHNTTQIAKTLNINHGTVYSIIRDAGILRPPQPQQRQFGTSTLTQQQMADINRYYNMNTNIRYVAMMVDLPEYAVRNYLTRKQYQQNAPRRQQQANV